MKLYYGKNSDVVESSEIEVVLDVATHRVLNWLSHCSRTDDEITDDVTRLAVDDPFRAIRLGLRDPVNPFVKNEPHPDRKVSHPRLIMGISLVDQLVERFFFSDVVSATKAAYPESCAMLGYGTDSNHLHPLFTKVREISKRCGFGPIASDVEGWERSVSLSSLQDAGRVMASLMGSSVTAQRVCDLWAATSAACCYVIDDRLWIKDVHGLMPSGSFLTSFANSIMRLRKAQASGAYIAIALGDDCLEWRPDDDVVAQYAAVGLNVRSVESYRGEFDRFSFCSRHIWLDGDQVQTVLTSWPKSIVHLATSGEHTADSIISVLGECSGLSLSVSVDIERFVRRVLESYPDDMALAVEPHLQYFLDRARNNEKSAAQACSQGQDAPEAAPPKSPPGPELQHVPTG